MLTLRLCTEKTPKRSHWESQPRGICTGLLAVCSSDNIFYAVAYRCGNIRRVCCFSTEDDYRKIVSHGAASISVLFLKGMLARGIDFCLRIFLFDRYCGLLCP